MDQPLMDASLTVARIFAGVRKLAVEVQAAMIGGIVRAAYGRPVIDLFLGMLMQRTSQIN
ncbi:hypothetical protein ACSBPU_12745 [Parapusillimonas sp. JC17]|uniref:hypothetical protein n=1 Tax=Parapusillimonas sp. JC17 TaxID=3445768 RepID=UPI003F9FFC49